MGTPRSPVYIVFNYMDPFGRMRYSRRVRYVAGKFDGSNPLRLPVGTWYIHMAQRGSH